MTNVTLERTAPTQNAPATYMPQAQGQAADRRIKEKAPADPPRWACATSICTTRISMR